VSGLEQLLPHRGPAILLDGMKEIGPDGCVATYRVKAGFDLSHKLEVNLAGQEVNIKIPKASILSVEPLTVKVDELRNGLWNKIQPEDIDRELKQMPEMARAKAASLPDEAEQTFERLLSERLGDLHVHVQIQADAEPGS